MGGVAGRCGESHREYSRGNGGFCPRGRDFVLAVSRAQSINIEDGAVTAWMLSIVMEGYIRGTGCHAQAPVSSIEDSLELPGEDGMSP